MRIVADSAPLIFLGKIQQLSLVLAVFQAEVLVPAVVKREVISPDIPPDEERQVTSFLSRCTVADPEKPLVFALGLSQTDNWVLTLARDKCADLILSDDRLLRRVSVLEGFGVVGTVGVLLRATAKGQVAPDNAEDLLQQLVRDHNFRISTAVFEEARRAFHGEAL